MNMTAGAIRELAAEALRTHQPAFAKPYEADREYTGNELLIFLKPDIIGLGERLDAVWQLILERLRAFQVDLVAGVALDADLLKRYRLIQQHYGVINQVSVKGAAAFSQTALANLDEFTRDLDEQPEVLGAHQFLERYTSFSPEALAVLYDNLETHRFAGGTYGVLVRIEGKPIILLNGFHPEQIELFESTGAAIMCFVGRSPRSWRELRQDLTGATDPRRAKAGSIRQQLLDRRGELGLGAVTPLRNGVHVSAGPVEAVVEIGRYLSPYETGPELPVRATSFGAQVIGTTDTETLEALCENREVVVDDVPETAFDATEERDAEEVLRMLETKRLRIAPTG